VVQVFDPVKLEEFEASKSTLNIFQGAILNASDNISDTFAFVE